FSAVHPPPSLTLFPYTTLFRSRYAELLAVVEARGAKKPVARSSFEWLVGQYRRSPEFRGLADATQLDYGRTLDLIVEELGDVRRSEEHTSELQSRRDLVCRLLL